MIIQEAIRSGRKFRRPCQDWITITDKSICCYLQLQVKDIMADDWEVEEKKVEITESRLRKALMKASYDQSFPSVKSYCDWIAKELGL
jgi:hypothetical protein